ncbi:MAG: hypothetical protein AABX16_04635, partial [Nanoarchaeota archaeon]
MKRGQRIVSLIFLASVVVLLSTSFVSAGLLDDVQNNVQKFFKNFFGVENNLQKAPAACNDGNDNDGDNKIDGIDPGCWEIAGDPLSWNQRDNDERDVENTLLAHYRFENDYSDSSGNNNHGTGFGNPTFVDGK